MNTETANAAQGLIGIAGQITIVFVGLLYFYGSVGFETTVVTMLFCIPLLFGKVQ